MPELRLENSLVDDRYVVRERLGLGSYAEIWVACDQQFAGRDIVLKALNTSLQGTPDVELERTLIENFQNEAVALDRVRHSHVILRLGHGTAADLRNVPFHYLVLEFMPGGDLLQLCRRQPGHALPLHAALQYFQQICEALAFAHEQGVIHRDLKPSNFLLSTDHQQVKIADFGVARLTSHTSAEITRVGTGIYAPPEHHPDEVDSSFGRLTAAADIYSLAKSFYTVICGRAPNEFYRRQITSLPANIQSHLWADALLNVLRRATTSEVAGRHASVTEFWSDLAGVAAHAEHSAAEEIETQVRPRLRVDRGTVPIAPVTPEFEKALASSGSMRAQRPIHQAVATGERKKPADYVMPARKGKGFVIDLNPAAPPERRESGPLAGNRQQQAVTVTDADDEKPQRVREAFKVALTTVVCAVALFVALLSVYRYASRYAVNKGAAQAEIMLTNLNVRTGPGLQYDVIGVVAQGSRHRILEHGDGWLRIEVSQWSSDPTVQAPVGGQKQGWISACQQCLRED